MAKHLSTSVDAVWRLLRKEGICLARQRTWCISTDSEFASKAADIIGLYLDAPTKALVIAVDEKPSIQALSRTTGYVITHNQKIVRGMKSTYRRNGTLNLFAALQVATGKVFAKPTKTKKRVDCLGVYPLVLCILQTVQNRAKIFAGRLVAKRLTALRGRSGMSMVAALAAVHLDP